MVIASPKFNNKELVMRINTDIHSGNYFATDLNGFQVHYIIFHVLTTILYNKFTSFEIVNAPQNTRSLANSRKLLSYD